MALSTLSDVKTYLKITEDSEDVRLGVLVEAANSFVKKYCSRDFDEAAIIEYFHGPDNVFLLKEWPVATSPAVVVYDDWQRTWGSDTIILATDYFVDYEAGIIYVDYSIGQGKGTVKVSYKAGYASGEIPADLTQACVEIAARKFKEGQGALGTPSRSIPDGGNVVFIVDDILPQTKIVLDKYSR